MKPAPQLRCLASNLMSLTPLKAKTEHHIICKGRVFHLTYFLHGDSMNELRIFSYLYISGESIKARCIEHGSVNFIMTAAWQAAINQNKQKLLHSDNIKISWHHTWALPPALCTTGTGGQMRETHSTKELLLVNQHDMHWHYCVLVWNTQTRIFWYVNNQSTREVQGWHHDVEINDTSFISNVLFHTPKRTRWLLYHDCLKSTHSTLAPTRDGEYLTTLYLK